MNKYFGIGITDALNKSLTLFVNNSILVVEPLKLKYYYYNKNQHKPIINLFIGITVGTIYPEDIVDE